MKRKTTMTKTMLLAALAATALGSGALAADLPRRHLPPPVIEAVLPPVFTWTGFYVGVQAGYAWGEDTATPLYHGAPVQFFDGSAVITDYEPQGFVGGAHVGYNQQFGGIVAGLEADFEGAGINETGDYNADLGFGASARASAKTELEWQGSVRARLGYAIDRVLVYGTGGVAFASIKNTYTAGAFDNESGAALLGPYTEHFDDTRVGWTVGGGVEYAITKHLTTRVEYRYTDFGDYENTIAVLGDAVQVQQEPRFHTVRAGLSYKF